MGVSILIVEDEVHARQNYETFLSDQGYDIIGVGTLAEAREHLNRGDVDIVLLDVNLPDGYGPNLLYEIQHMSFKPMVILITAFGDIEMAVDAMKNGASDFLQKPVELSRLNQAVERASEFVTMRRELEHYRQSHQQEAKFVVGKSKEMTDLISHAQRAAARAVSVLITGETGTGKEILAKYIHTVGPRSSKPFIAINCAAIQPTMLESELFGYEAGAFTGADKRKNGLLEIADEGILFLDEISSMPLDIQAKLLRVLEERAFRRVGGTKLLNIDVQVLAASNRELTTMMKEAKFREDLYYRLKVVDLHLPALRERKADIPALVGYFVRKFNAKMGMNVENISQAAMNALVAYDWPGNIRELHNAIERAMLFCDDGAIDIAQLSSSITHQN
jgi:DNA-binding NtrC family response regulator